MLDGAGHCRELGGQGVGGRTALRIAELSERWRVSSLPQGFDPQSERAKAAAFVRQEALKSPKIERGAWEGGGWPFPVGPAPTQPRFLSLFISWFPIRSHLRLMQ